MAGPAWRTCSASHSPSTPSHSARQQDYVHDYSDCLLMSRQSAGPRSMTIVLAAGGESPPQAARYRYRRHRGQSWPLLVPAAPQIMWSCSRPCDDPFLAISGQLCRVCGAVCAPYARPRSGGPLRGIRTRLPPAAAPRCPGTIHGRRAGGPPTLPAMCGPPLHLPFDALRSCSMHWILCIPLRLCMQMCRCMPSATLPPRPPQPSRPPRPPARRSWCVARPTSTSPSCARGSSSRVFCPTPHC